MNIFFLHQSPVQSAQWQVDKHVVKMILESAQMLSTAHRIIDGEEGILQVKQKVGYIDESTGDYIQTGTKTVNKKHWFLPDHRENLLYKVAHKNHPSTIWTRKSLANYNWLVDHMFALGEEYTHRYGKVHKTIRELGYDLQCPPINLKEMDWTDPPCCMPDEYITSPSPIQNYRNYYKYDKAEMHVWTNREPPEWINE